MELTAVQVASFYKGETSLRSLLGVSTDQMVDFAGLACRWYSQGRYAQAKVIFQGLAALDESSFHGHAGLGVIALVQDDLEGAVSHLRRAHEINPKDPTVSVNLGEALLQAGELEEGVRLLEAAMNQDPGHVNPFVNRARAMMQGVKNQLQQSV